ncbi:unnamed protein product [Chrysodeixis includens]|uniref:Uncharacterized protein n=1 Tax=Chrysodeixis includens TaxID=689277 RepID=A0A9N8KTP7_CHRIL|nr:unnamed protein product [Chrysodeixis includens]
MYVVMMHCIQMYKVPNPHIKIFNAVRHRLSTLNRKRKKYTRKPRERNEAEKEAILFAKEVTFGFGVNEPSICICWYLSYNILPAIAPLAMYKKARPVSKEFVSCDT